MKQRIILTSLTALVALGCLAGPALSDEVADGLARAKENLVKYTAKPEFVAPGEPFDAKSCAAGKKMMSIPNNSGNPFLKGIIDRMKAAGAEVGLDVREWENQGQPSQWVQGVELAIRDKYDIIDLISGIDPGTIAAAAGGRQGRRRQGDDLALLRSVLRAEPGGVELAHHRLRRDRHDPRGLVDGRDRRQGQHRDHRLQRSAADHSPGRELQEAAAPRTARSARSSRRSMSA